MKKEFYQRQGDQWYKVGRNQSDCALTQLNNRLKHSMPVELIDADQMRKMIKGVNVKCDRSLSPEEAAQLLESVKGFLLNAIDNMQTYSVPRSVPSNLRGR